MSAKQKKRGRKSVIDFQNIQSPDFRAGLLAEMGMSNNYISDQTGLTSGQISYRTRQCGIFRRDYRNGQNAISQLLIGNIGKLLGKGRLADKGSAYDKLRESSLLLDRSKRA